RRALRHAGAGRFRGEAGAGLPVPLAFPPADGGGAADGDRAPLVKVELFDFHLPPERIAQTPAEPRDSARLLEVRPDALADRAILDLPDLLNPGDLLVFNDTRV